ncbi:MAG: hypothetical protein NTW25_14810 [Candidatus Kapabacteria bacterium]|nr:hypothetical protein [Candidatus Kapabacteria bacterium]
MKKIFLLLVMFSQINIAIFSQIDEFGNTSFKLKQVINKNIDQLDSIPSFEIKFDNFRALSEINTPLQAEAYPWISNDGLRLYYTKSDSNSNNKSMNYIYYADRKSINDKFTNQTRLAFNSDTSSNISCWLTNDELNMYFMSQLIGSSSRHIYHTSRNTTNDNFKIPILVSLVGKINGSIIGPSLTSDLNQLYFRCQDNSSNVIKKNNIYVFNKIGEDNYSLVDSLNVPSGYFPGPGAITSDGLKYYLSLDSAQKRQIYFFNRNSISEKFNELFLLKNKFINDTSFSNFQPHISSSSRFFVFTRNNTNNWFSNDLYLYQKYNKIRNNKKYFVYL